MNKSTKTLNPINDIQKKRKNHRALGYGMLAGMAIGIGAGASPQTTWLYGSL